MGKQDARQTAGKETTAEEEETQKAEVKAKMKIRHFFWLAMFLAVLFGSRIVRAASANDDNKSGVAYGTAVNKDTAYVSWDDRTYINLHYYNSIDFNFKILSATSDSVIIRFLGSNAKPDTLHYYDLIRADTVVMASAGDSIVHITFPYGTTPPTTSLSRYMKVEIYLYDADAGGAAQATISDSWIAR
jgi:hypothetical protein